ncbi:MAG TPA: DUF116 domain-containing protein [Bacteroidota bacterium]|nr:DUF116 domain-containing protein [Bacteroidota bacterium]
MSGPLTGKTYSLQDADGSSDAYYERISGIADRFMRTSDTGDLLRTLEQIRTNKGRVRSRNPGSADRHLSTTILNALHENLSRYTVNVGEHLRTLPLVHRWDRVLAMTEPQYHCSLLEIELINRLNAFRFRRCTTKLAFLPHCLRDLTADCHSAVRGVDYVCKGCSKICAVNAVSKTLRRHGVTPYIWMTANLKALFRSLRKEGKEVGVFGIACVPELERGMRMCMRAGVPVVGVPLDANRCRRWWGEFHANAVNLTSIENLLGDETLLKPRGQGSSVR